MLYLLCLLFLSIKNSDLFQGQDVYHPIYYDMSFTIDDVKPNSCSINKNDQTITCPPGTDKTNASVITKKVTNLPNGYFNRREYTCNTVTSNKNQKCYIQLFFANYSFSENDFALPGNTIKSIIKPIENNSFVKIFFYSGDTESVFKLPNVRFINRNINYKNYGEPKLEKVRDNVYKATVDITTTDKLYIKTISLQNAHDLSPLVYDYNEFITHTNTNVMMFPFIANETYIVGINVENDDFFAMWHVRKDNTGQFMEFAMKPRTKFSLTYIIIEKKTSSFRDAIEKWHFSFPEIYTTSYGPGTWVDQVKPQSLSEEVFKTFMPKYYWGYYPDNKVSNLYSYRYVYASVIGTEDIKCNESFDQVIRDCAPSRIECEIARDYGERDLNNKLTCHDNFRYTAFAQPILFYGKAKDYKLKNVREALTKGNYSGVAVDSFIFFDATYHSNPPVDLCPFYSLDDGNNDIEFISVMATFLDIFKNLSDKAPRGFIINSKLTIPQLSKYVALGGYEVTLTNYGLFQPWFYKRLWTHRFILGSKAMSHLDTSNTYSLYEEFFSICAAIGCTPSSSRFFDRPDFMKIMKPHFDKWRPMYEEMFTDSVFMANGGGRVIADDENWGSFCKANGECFVSFFSMKENNKINATISSNPKCYYVPEDSTCEIKDDKVTIQSNKKYRTVIIKYEGENYNQSHKSNSKTKIIVSVVVVILVLIVIAAVIIGIVVARKKNSKQSSSASI